MPNVEEYYGLVMYQARKIHRSLLTAGKEEIQLDELIQEGMIGLLDAAQRFDPQAGASFGTYSERRIEGAMRDYLLRRLDPLTSRERRKVKELERIKKALEHSLGRPPTAGEVAESLRTTEETVRQTAALSMIILCLEETARCVPGTGERLPWEAPSPQSDPEERVTKKNLAHSIDACLQEALTDHERAVITLRFEAEMTHERIGKILNVSTASAHRWEVIARQKLRHCLEGKGWEITDI